MFIQSAIFYSVIYVLAIKPIKNTFTKNHGFMSFNWFWEQRRSRCMEAHLIKFNICYRWQV